MTAEPTAPRRAPDTLHEDGRAQTEPTRMPNGDERMGVPVARITGCSTGIGRATAATLPAAGYRVVATARRPETLDGLGAAMALALDVTDGASINTAVDAVLQRF